MGGGKMKNIVFHKLGMEKYAGGKDKNSGLYEYNLILKELEKIDEQVKDETLIVLNGTASKEEKEKVETMIENSHIAGAKAIYIVTDEVAFEDIEFVNKFDVVLHQAWRYKFANINCEQDYSYVPELFYTGEIENSKYKSDLLLFCGNDTGRQDKIKDYLRDDKGCKPNTFSLIKYKDGEDERIEHDEYLKLLRRFKYSLMICRKSYRYNGWITARLIEAIDAWSLPVFDFEYDVNNAYRISELVVTPECKRSGFMKVYLAFKNKEDKVTDALIDMREKVEKRRKNFAKVILKYAK